MIFEKLNKNDIKEISKIFMKAFNKAPWHDNWTTETSEKRFFEFMNSSGFYGIKACIDGKIVGVILGNSETYYNGMLFYIRELFIDPEFEGRGIGSSILNELTKNLKDKHIKRIYLLTVRSQSTIGFYEKNKFEIDDNIVNMGMDLY